MSRYYGPDGRLITESIRDYTRVLCGRAIPCVTDEFLRKWSDADQKKAIIKELEEEGVFWEPLSMEVERKLGKQFNPFRPYLPRTVSPLSRRERADLDVKTISPNTVSKLARCSKHC